MKLQPAFPSLSSLFSSYGYQEDHIDDDEDKYMYFEKTGKDPVQVNRLKLSYSNMDLSMFASAIGEPKEEFIAGYYAGLEFIEKYSEGDFLKKFLKKSEDKNK